MPFYGIEFLLNARYTIVIISVKFDDIATRTAQSELLDSITYLLDFSAVFGSSSTSSSPEELLDVGG